MDHTSFDLVISMYIGNNYVFEFEELVFEEEITKCMDQKGVACDREPTKI
jgi:hypothetical protein